MANAQVFTCNYGGSVKNKLLKSGEKLFLKIDGEKVSGKAFICNEEGKNGYIDSFEYPISDVREVFKGDYQGNQALIMNSRLTSLYGTKKTQTIFPSMKDIDIVIEKIAQLQNENHVSVPEPRQATTQQQPIARPTSPETAPVPPKPEIKQAPTPSPQVETKQEDNSAVGSLLLSRRPTTQPTAPSTIGSARLNTSKPAVPEEKAPAPTPAPEPIPAAKPQPPKKEAEDPEKRIEKLFKLKEIGMLTDNEFDAKKGEFIKELCDNSTFTDKVKKLVSLYQKGMLTDIEFEEKKEEIVTECTSSAANLAQYKNNISKLPFLAEAGMITDLEFEEKKEEIIRRSDFSDSDPDNLLVKKLERWPILKEAKILTEDEYRAKVQDLIDIIDVSEYDNVPLLKQKLKRWPVLVEARIISDSELKRKQANVSDTFANLPWNTIIDFESVVERLVALKECEWMSEADFNGRKKVLVTKVDKIEDYTTKLEFYMQLPRIGLLTEAEFNQVKQRFVEEIFSSYETMEEFQAKAKRLMDMNKVGIISEDEYNNYKIRLMSEV